jgi:hypothetical protein
LIFLAPVVIKLSHLNLGEAYIAMTVTMPSMKNVFQNTIRSTFPFLKMNSSITCYKVKLPKSSRPSNEKWEEEESDYDDYDINYLALHINKSKIDDPVSKHYSTMNG